MHRVLIWGEEIFWIALLLGGMLFVATEDQRNPLEDFYRAEQAQNRSR